MPAKKLNIFHLSYMLFIYCTYIYLCIKCLFICVWNRKDDLIKYNSLERLTLCQLWHPYCRFIDTIVSVCARARWAEVRWIKVRTKTLRLMLMVACRHSGLSLRQRMIHTGMRYPNLYQLNHVDVTEFRASGRLETFTSVDKQWTNTNHTIYITLIWVYNTYIRM